jgi:hypothetical protein
MNWTSIKYLWQVRRAISLRRMRKNILSALREPVLDYSRKHPKANLRAYWERFGDPRQVAENAIENEEAEAICQEISRTKRIWWIWAVVGAFAIAGLMFTFRTMILENREATNGFFSEEVIEEVNDK